MTPERLICTDDVAPQPWRNGGGVTRELLAWPSTEQARVRIAVADIETDGPFSTYADVERWIVPIDGVGIELSFGDERHQLVLGSEPFRFNGANAPDCRLLNGPTRDLNLMAQGGVGSMRTAKSGVAWDENFSMRGLFTTVTGTWAASNETRRLPAMNLLWFEDGNTAEWTFQFDESPSTALAWWLGFTPDSLGA